MKSELNLQDLIYFKGQPGKVVGLLEGGEKVIIQVNGENITMVEGHPELLTVKQKEHRDKIKAHNAQINAEALAKAHTPVVIVTPAKEPEPIGQVDKPVEAPKAAPAKAPAKPKAPGTPVVNNVDSKPE